MFAPTRRPNTKQAESERHARAMGRLRDEADTPPPPTQQPHQQPHQEPQPRQGPQLKQELQRRRQVEVQESGEGYGVGESRPVYKHRAVLAMEAEALRHAM